MGGTSDTGRNALQSSRDVPRGAQPAKQDELDDQESHYMILMEDPVFVNLRMEHDASIRVVLDCIDDFLRVLRTYQREFDGKLEAYLRVTSNAFRTVRETAYSKSKALEDTEQLIEIIQRASELTPGDIHQDKAGGEESKFHKTVREFHEFPESIPKAQHRLLEALTEFGKKDLELKQFVFRMTHPGLAYPMTLASIH